jgi:dTDP-glucose 4,6-dehydratase
MSKKALVTGGAGFIGHILVEYLLKNTDWEIVSIDRLDYSGNLNRLSHVMNDYNPKEKSRVKIIHHDLKSEVNNLIESQIRDVNYVFHLAASSHVDRSITDPMGFVYDNVVGTANLLNYARNLNNLEAFVYFSTDEVFGPAPEGVSFKEWDRYNSTNPYSASKAGGEEMAIAFENTYNLPIIITHTMNVFGERQHPEKYVPNTLWKLKNGEKITIHANKSKTEPGSRHYVYVEDVADAVYYIVQNLDKVRVSSLDIYGAKCPKVNIPGTSELNNLEVAQLISKFAGLELNYELVDFHSSRPGHDLRYSIDDSFIKSLGWQPKFSVEDGFEKITKWYLENSEWLDF